MRSLTPRRFPWVKPVVLLTLIVLISLGHDLTPLTRQAQHDILVRLYYFPIVLGGLWYGLTGGLAAASLIALVYTPHVLLVNHGPLTIGYLLEIPIFLAVGLLIGLMVDRQEHYRRGLEIQAETLAQSHRELQEQTHLLLEKETQLRRADRLSALGQLSAGLAHEIRNPLGAIKGAVEILQDDFPPGHPKAEFYTILLREVERLNEVLTNFLSFARPVTAHLVPQDVQVVLSALEGLISGQARAHRVQIFTSFHTGPSRVLVDETLLKQAFLNIMLNAVEAMPNGGDLAISTRLSPDGRAGRPEWLEVVFDDTGPGIQEADMGRIFDPFFTTKKDGTGL
ncbi:MAG TPA: histidine kinase dimerization/phospho-acceptor domain-containing protein, partial [Candidatus Methylomirabilis sp.]|nr:histidine kinase dimerization/phospho-acceptor domain-containing protein [Candidatus Methylomirabilis sp.]